MILLPAPVSHGASGLPIGPVLRCPVGGPWGRLDLFLDLLWGIPAHDFADLLGRPEFVRQPDRVLLLSLLEGLTERIVLVDGSRGRPNDLGQKLQEFLLADDPIERQLFVVLVPQLFDVGCYLWVF
jgi:hypothetical protein